ncbi:thiopurine S-methyltransferase [Colwellia chukchiensis]|uniref:Thiopurine S-methyltransferase n=1 Tax=Colwellia chukchiensis TaxID=641665 RepID=A0A1H7KDJ8_9GAMM|nr:thiopurine S-methyltransferase [Colwellia chukchiensis]SEK84017.1 thiopurine S-methyltransferase [Colwellia chukchiensis]
MENSFWHSCWERNSLGFHQASVHPFLPQYFEKLRLATDQHVFVPLCGKSSDMAYLAQFFQVTGSELSEIACRDFFSEHQVAYQQAKVAPFKRFDADKLTLWQGDFFQLTSEHVAPVDWIYDRAALIALPLAMQQSYVEHLKQFFKPSTRLFLLTLEFPTEQLTGPPFAVNNADVAHLFTGFNVACIAERELENKQFAQRRFDVDYLIEKLYIISWKN